MMQRHMPMGYQMKNGKIQFDKAKVEVVKKIFNSYDSGISTCKLAKELTIIGFLNANNKPSWNHCSIGRILENTKYLGDEFYPQMIDKALFEQVQNRRKEQCKSLGRIAKPNSMGNQNTFSGRLYCGECGETFRKYIEHCGKQSEKSKWKCKKYIDKNKVHCRCGGITDQQIKEAFIAATNQILQNKKILDRKRKVIPPFLTSEFQTLNQTIKELESDGQQSSKELIALIFNRAKIVYKTAKIKDYEYTTAKMKQAFTERKLLEEYDDKLFQEVIKKVTIYADKRITFTFINQIAIDIT